jgi:cytochrome c-type biogenesis protein CcmE
VRALTEKLMMYALNRELEYYDMPQVRAVVREAGKNNYKFSSIVLGIVNTDAFRKQGPAVTTKQNEVKTVAAATR